MAQNRNKLIDLFIGNISNSIVHKILEKAIDNKEITIKYERELSISWKIAKRYREKINPINRALQSKDANYIKTKMVTLVRAELLMRISKGYKGINLDFIEELVDKALKDMSVI